MGFAALYCVGSTGKAECFACAGMECSAALRFGFDSPSIRLLKLPWTFLWLETVFGVRLVFWVPQ